jgi:hypothetical protein
MMGLTGVFSDPLHVWVAVFALVAAMAASAVFYLGAVALLLGRHENRERAWHEETFRKVHVEVEAAHRFTLAVAHAHDSMNKQLSDHEKRIEELEDAVQSDGK